MAATMVITIRSGWAQAAPQMVSDGPGPVETMTRGNSAVNTAALAATMPSALSPNAAAARPAPDQQPGPSEGHRALAGQRERYCAGQTAGPGSPVRRPGRGAGDQRSGWPAEPYGGPAGPDGERPGV